MKRLEPSAALAHVLELADEYAATLCCHTNRQAQDAIRIVREETRKHAAPLGGSLDSRSAGGGSHG